MARPSHDVTEGKRKEVGLWSAAGLTQERCAAMLGIHVDTFRKHYAEDYDNGKDNMVKSLFEKSYQVAMDEEHKDSSKERQFLLKTRGGYTEKQSVEHSGGIALTGFAIEFHDANHSEAED